MIDKEIELDDANELEDSDEVEQEDTAADLAEDAAEAESLLEDLASTIQAKFGERADKRSAKEQQWLRSAELYYGKLSKDNGITKPETPFQPRFNRNRPDVNIVRSKCNIAIAQTVSMQFGTSNKNWDLLPSKNASTPQNIEACAKMSSVIEEQLEATKYSYHCRKAMWDRVILGSGILKGPKSEGRLVHSYQQIEDSAVWEAVVEVDTAPVIKRINPWFFYPDETVEDVHDIQDAIEVHPMSALELKKLTKHKGFRAAAIKEVLSQKPREYAAESWADFARLSENNPNLYKDRYTVLEYHGPIAKEHLEAVGIEPAYESDDCEYYGEVWACQGQVIRIELADIEATYSIPYYMCNWEKDPGSVFGYGVPLMMEDAQRVVNESWHMILDNSSLSSGPQVALQRGLIEPANGQWVLEPGQMWYLTDPQAQVQQAIQFFNVPNVTQNLIPIMQMAQGFAEEESCIPLITGGLNSPEVGDTATGQLMIRTASTTILDFMSEDWDDNITSPVISNWYAWNMQYNPDSTVKGQFAVDVRTSTEYKNKQLYLRDLEKLSVESAQNPELAKNLNLGDLARMRIEMMTLPSRHIIKTKEQVEAEDKERQANAQPDPVMLELQLKGRELSIKEAQLQLEAQQMQAREVMDHEEKMAAAKARLVESEARVAVSQNEKETEILKLAQKDKATTDKLTSSERIARENNMTKAFTTSLQEVRKQQEADSYQSEIDLAATKGQGV